MLSRVRGATLICKLNSAYGACPVTHTCTIAPPPPAVPMALPMLEAAQAKFRAVVRAQLRELLASGTPRNVAVATLMSRISAGTVSPAPSRATVDDTMRMLGLGRDDAERALRVKYEVDHLVAAGMDPIGAFAQLTTRMAGLTPDGAFVGPASATDAGGVDEAGEQEGGGCASGDRTQAEAGAGAIASVQATPTTRSAQRKRRSAEVGSSNAAAPAPGPAPAPAQAPAPELAEVRHRDKRVRFTGPDSSDNVGAGAGSGTIADGAQPSGDVRGKAARAKRSLAQREGAAQGQAGDAVIGRRKRSRTGRVPPSSS